jgi:predicted transcriptional regulator
MSIRPPFASAILEGSKRVEFRKRRLASDIDRVVIYITAPVMAVVGEFQVAGQVVSTPAALWRRFSRVAGIERDAFFEYFGDSAEAVGILIESVTEYDHPQPLQEFDPGSRPPQSFRYLVTV